ncbi:MAG TPA: TadE/TadG family type IV pilus assembly protein [Sphingomonas sp.]|jgi:Flp pilus assembly protein TadG
MRRLVRDIRGVAMLEFAFVAPLVLLTGCFGVEIANYALAQLRVSQIALALADNASRVGISSSLATQQLREVDIADVLQATRTQGQRINITKYGRVTLSSLEADAAGAQRIRWQRCLGLMTGPDYVSHFGATSPTDGSDTTSANDGYNGLDPAGDSIASNGMGPIGGKVEAPPQSGVMFVEVNYQYRPLFGSWLVGTRRIHYIASFIVRDRRDFAQIFNPNPQVAVGDKLTCNRFTV